MRCRAGTIGRSWGGLREGGEGGAEGGEAFVLGGGEGALGEDFGAAEAVSLPNPELLAALDESKGPSASLGISCAPASSRSPSIPSKSLPRASRSSPPTFIRCLA